MVFYMRCSWSTTSHSLFHFRTVRGIIILTIYVDDIVMTRSATEGINVVKLVYKNISIPRILEMRCFLGLWFYLNKKELSYLKGSIF